MADNSGLMKVGLIGGAAVLAWYKGWLAPLGIAGPASSSAAPGAAPGTAAQPAAHPVGPSLSSLYAAMVAAAANDPAVKNNTAGPDTWNYYLMQVYPVMGAAPDPTTLFPGVDRSKPMTAAAYWTGASVWLQANKGLSGLNAYRGLGALAMRQGWGVLSVGE